MIQPAFEILNQRGTPMFFSDVFSNRPTAGIVGRIFISTDTKELYRDTGTTWELLAGPGSGTITGSGAAGQVSFFTGTNTIAGDNSLFWDNTNKRLGIGANSLSYDFTIFKNIAPTINTTNDNNGSNLTYGTNIFQWDLVGRRNSITSSMVRILATYNGDGITRRGKFQIGVAESSGFGGINFQLTQTPANDKVSILGYLAGTYSDTDTTITTAYSLHAQNIISGRDILPILSVDRFGLIQAVIFGTGNFALGSTTDNGNRFQVSGDVSFSNILYCSLFYYGSGAGNTKTFLQQNAVGGTLFSITSSNNYVGTSNLIYCDISGGNFAPTSGSGQFTALQIIPNINQTGTATGISRGLYINPNLISAVNYRSIEFSNNTGWGIYGIGTAFNTLAGKTIIGSTNITGSGLLQVTNSSGDDHLRIWGSTAPSLRIDNAVSAATQRFVLGLSTATNNFIQGSTSGDICIATASANPLLFGMWQTTSATEVQRISTALNVLIGSATDTGEKFQLTGSIRVNGQTSGTAGGSSGQHLIVNCDGTIYKIALLNV
jgi:hypothetical protein